MTFQCLANSSSAFCCQAPSGIDREAQARRGWAPRRSHTAPPLTFPGRWLQPRAWLGLPDAWGLPAVQQTRGKARGNEYQPSNIKRKNKHGWIRRLSKPNGVQVILRRMHKGRKSLSH